MRIPKQQKLVQQGQEKYHCRFCDKAFSTGRALGGHMRIHRMSNEPTRQQDEAPSSTGPEGRDSSDGDRLPARHICENCSEEFGSLKSWSKHCCVGDGGADGDDDDDSNGLSPPPPLLLTEEEHLAHCLVLLSNARGALSNPRDSATDGVECSTMAFVPIRITEAGECSVSERKEIVDYVVVVPPLPEVPPQVSTETPPTAREIYECKTCQKVFNSHQALGGHRASHKKVRGCFANRLESKPTKIARYTTMEDESNNRSSSENMALAIVPFGEAASSQLPSPKQKTKVHECRICNRQFPSGQALGGHMRSHWSGPSFRGAGAAAPIAAEPLSVVATEMQVGNSSTEPLLVNSTIFSLDLNMPAPTDDFSECTLWVDIPNAMNVEPEREISRENVLNVNIKEAHSREVRLTDLGELIDMNEREGGSKWLHIGFGSISDQENGADQS